jgi:hypothetical protein
MSLIVIMALHLYSSKDLTYVHGHKKMYKYDFVRTKLNGIYAYGQQLGLDDASDIVKFCLIWRLCAVFVKIKNFQRS